MPNGKNSATLLLIFVFSLSYLTPVSAGSLERNKAIRAIIGEASGEGKDGMLALAAALRNRGTFKGVYGLNAKHIDREPAWVWRLAEEAWDRSEFEDPTDGADHWGSVFVDKEWIKKMDRTMEFKVQVNNQRFYKG